MVEAYEDIRQKIENLEQQATLLEDAMMGAPFGYPSRRRLNIRLQCVYSATQALRWASGEYGYPQELSLAATKRSIQLAKEAENV